ncbi:ribosome-inactivating family protein [Streptomyces sp. NPDC006529]|uniref:ribosome-inactivating family protein n=1 Tax=Streptomyces sp. NPDC006529 TaxID=3157177 RepID=UPI00339F97E1
MLKRLYAMLLSMAVAMGLVTTLSTPASATYNVIDYNVSRITDGGQEHAANYFRVIGAIHTLSYGDTTGQTGITQTQDNFEERLIQVRIRDTGGRDLVSLYFWPDTLYLAGFYAAQGAGPDRHFAFNDDRSAAFSRALNIGPVRLLGRTGNYSSLPGGNNRETIRLTPQNMYHAATVLSTATGYTDDVGRQLLFMAQAFAEASRFGPILDRAYSNFYHHTDTALGTDYAGLENQWSALSDFVNARLHNRPASISIFGQNVTNFDQLRQRVSFVELLGSRVQR